MGRKSKISRLPADVKLYVEGLLADGRLTLAEMVDNLHERFPDQAKAGELPSRTGLHNHYPKLERRLIAIKASTEAAKLIQAQAGDSKDARSEALTALVQTELFEAILQLQEADELDADGNPRDPSDRVAMLSAAAKNIATLTRSSVNLKQFQAKVEEDTRQQLLAEQRAKLDAMGTKGGVTADTLQAIRAALGIK